MKNVYFTSDTHFGHKNIVRFSNRPFVNVQEMDDVLIENINKIVKQDDILYHLGDWSWTNPIVYRKRINCNHIHLIFGNHDKKKFKRYKGSNLYFSSTGPQVEIGIDGQDITLNHYAMRVWNKSHYGAWHLYGHSHGSLPDDPNSLSFDVGVDCWDYRPVSIDEVKTRMSFKKFVPIDHHGKREFEVSTKRY